MDAADGDVVPVTTQREFYEKPYATCKDCLQSKFKCKECLQQLMSKLRDYRKQHDVAMETQRKQLARHYFMKGLTSNSQSQKESQGHVNPYVQSALQQVKLSSLNRAVPVLRQTIIALPERHSKEALKAAAGLLPVVGKLGRQRHRNSQELLNAPDPHEEDEVRVSNRLSVHTLEVPTVEKEVIRYEPKPKNRPKAIAQIQHRKNKVQDDGLLPCIQQLNIRQRQRQSLKKPSVGPSLQTIRHQHRRKSMQLGSQHRTTNRTTPTTSLHALLPLSAWEHHDRNEDINY